jgi:hypothetical protein
MNPGSVGGLRWLTTTNAMFRVTATGSLAGEQYRTLGILRVERQQKEVTLGLEQGLVEDVQVVVLTNGRIAHIESITPSSTVSVPTNAFQLPVTPGRWRICQGFMYNSPSRPLSPQLGLRSTGMKFGFCSPRQRAWNICIRCTWLCVDWML